MQLCMQRVHKNMRPSGSRAAAVHVPFGAKEKDVGAGDHKGKDDNSQGDEKG